MTMHILLPGRDQWDWRGRNSYFPPKHSPPGLGMCLQLLPHHLEELTPGTSQATPRSYSLDLAQIPVLQDPSVVLQQDGTASPLPRCQAQELIRNEGPVGCMSTWERQ